MELKTYFAQDAQGNVIPNPAVHVYFVGTTTYATGLKNATGGALANPFTGSDKGQIQFAAPNGDYDMRVVSGVRDYSIRVRFVDIDDQRLLAEAAATEATNAAAQAQQVLAEAVSLNPNLNPAFRTNSRRINDDTVLASGNNAVSVGPILITPGVRVTIQPGARWKII